MSQARPGVRERVLVLGDAPQSVAVVRALARAGLEVVLGTAERASSTALSRFVADVWVYDDASPQRFCNHVEAFLRSERPQYVFPIGEGRLRCLVDAAPRLMRLSRWAIPEFATVARCLDRRAMADAAASAGLAVLGAEDAGAPQRACHVAAADGRLLACADEALASQCAALALTLRYTGTGIFNFAAGGHGVRAPFAGIVPGVAFPLVAIELAAGRVPRSPIDVRAAHLQRADWRDPLPALHAWWRKHLAALLERRLPSRLRT